MPSETTAVLTQLNAAAISPSQDGYFISDLEGAACIDAQSEVAQRSGSNNIGCIGHDSALLVDGVYTEVSEMKMLGSLFKEQGLALSVAGCSLRDRLLAGEVPTASAARTDRWFAES